MIIGLTGKARSGKSTIADYLVRERGFVKINFKDALIKEMRANLKETLEQLAKYYEVPDDHILFSEKPPIMRALMQNYGTDIRRKDSSSYWTDQWLLAVDIAQSQDMDIVVDDVRFLNEAEAVKSVYGKVFRVVRIGQVASDNPTHISETEMDSIETDADVVCSDGIENAYSAAEDIINYFK